MRQAMIQIVTVVNKYNLYNEVIRENPFMNPHSLHVYDNTKTNIGIARRYNDFIKNQMTEDSWIIFCHQDFGFKEAVTDKIEALDKNYIYGPIGVGAIKQFVFIVSISRYGVERFRIGFYDRTKQFGCILQKTHDKTAMKGKHIRKPVVVETVDSCCVIVHSSLIKKHNLSFDEHLEWHLYAEDFSLNAKRNCRVLTKAAQFDCTHYSAGNVDHVFYDHLNYLRKKYQTDRFATTCFDGYYRF